MKQKVKKNRCPVSSMVDKVNKVDDHELMHSKSKSGRMQTTCNRNISAQAQESLISDQQFEMLQTEANNSVDSHNIEQKRGPTLCKNIWSSTKRRRVQLNGKGQPIGDCANSIKSFLGTIARNGRLLPITYLDWRAVPKTAKEDAWKEVLEKFDISEVGKIWFRKSLAKKWKDWKAKLKAFHYYEDASFEENLLNCDPRVSEEQWRASILFWMSDEGKKRSERNKANRAKQLIHHTGGTRSFAQIAEDMRESRSDKREPSRAELFIVTHKKKNGKAVDKESAKIITQMETRISERHEDQLDPIAEDDIFAQVMGPEKSNYIRGCGLGPTPSDIWGPLPSRTEALKMAFDAKKVANEEITKMQKEVKTMKENSRRQQAQYDSLIDFMKSRLSGDDLKAFLASQQVPASYDDQATSSGQETRLSASSQNSSPLKRDSEGDSGTSNGKKNAGKRKTVQNNVSIPLNIDNEKQGSNKRKLFQDDADIEEGDNMVYETFKKKKSIIKRSSFEGVNSAPIRSMDKDLHDAKKKKTQAPHMQDVFQISSRQKKPLTSSSHGSSPSKEDKKKDYVISINQKVSQDSSKRKLCSRDLELNEIDEQTAYETIKRKKDAAAKFGLFKEGNSTPLVNGEDKKSSNTRPSCLINSGIDEEASLTPQILHKKGFKRIQMTKDLTMHNKNNEQNTLEHGTNASEALAPKEMDTRLKRLMEHISTGKSLHTTNRIPTEGQNEAFLLSMKKPHKIVARGNIVSKCPTTKVGGVVLDKLFWEVHIDLPIIPNEVLPRPYECYKTIGDCIGATIAWPKFMVKTINQSA